MPTRSKKRAVQQPVSTRSGCTSQCFASLRASLQFASQIEGGYARVFRLILILLASLHTQGQRRSTSIVLSRNSSNTRPGGNRLRRSVGYAISNRGGTWDTCKTSSRPTPCYRGTAATQGQVETGFAGAWATPLVIGEGLGTLRQTRTHAPENKSVT